MGEDEFNDETEWEELMSALEEGPSFRMTIAGGRLTLVRWFPSLIPRSCPAGNLFRPREDAGVTIADLTTQRSDTAHELTVNYLVEGGGELAEHRLLQWTGMVGYTRVWLPDRIVEPRARTILGRAHCVCPSCGADWQDSTTEFWAQVHHDGHFPCTCPLCGSDLPQWSLSKENARRRARPVGAPQSRQVPTYSPDS